MYRGYRQLYQKMASNKRFSIDIKKQKLQENKDATESYLRKIEKLEEDHRHFDSQIIDRPKYETKLKQLEKLETMISMVV